MQWSSKKRGSCGTVHLCTVLRYLQLRTDVPIVMIFSHVLFKSDQDFLAVLIYL